MSDISKIASGYFHDVFDPTWAKMIESELSKYIKRSGIQFDTVAFRGMSGALIAPGVARKLNKHLLMCRKSGDGNHSGMSWEGYKQMMNYIIIDDFISSGNTIRTITKTVAGHASFGLSRLVAVFCYKSPCGGSSIKLKACPQAANEVEVPVFNMWMEQSDITGLRAEFSPVIKSKIKPNEAARFFNNGSIPTQMNLELAEA